jgi:hypothetical protein
MPFDPGHQLPVAHPYTIESHRSSHNVVYETARTDLMNLAERGLLVPQKVGKAWHFVPCKISRSGSRTLPDP